MTTYLVTSASGRLRQADDRTSEVPGARFQHRSIGALG